MVQVKLKRFDPASIDDSRTVLVTARRGSGKTTLARALLYHHKHIPYGVIMSATEEANAAYSELCPALFIYSNFREDVLKKLIQRQKKLCRDGRLTPCFLVLDDVLFQKGVLACDTVRELFCNGRHYAIFTIVLAQGCGQIPPDLRSQFDYCVALREPSLLVRKKLYEYFFSSTGHTFKQFCTLLDATTVNFECLVINNITCETAWYKAPLDLPPFRMGCRQFWEFNDINFDPQRDPTEESAKQKRVVVVKRGKASTDIIIRKMK